MKGPIWSFSSWPFTGQKPPWRIRGQTRSFAGSSPFAAKVKLALFKSSILFLVTRTSTNVRTNTSAGSWCLVSSSRRMTRKAHTYHSQANGASAQGILHQPSNVHFSISSIQTTGSLLGRVGPVLLLATRPLNCIENPTSLCRGGY